VVYKDPNAQVQYTPQLDVLVRLCFHGRLEVAAGCGHASIVQDNSPPSQRDTTAWRRWGVRVRAHGRGAAMPRRGRARRRRCQHLGRLRGGARGVSQ
jgi:hypothetical protein